MRGLYCTLCLKALAVICCGICCGLVLTDVRAQDTPQPAVTNPTLTSPPVTARGAAAVQKQWAAAAKSARQLRADSVDAFNRGLLPLTDHLEHLSAAYEAEGRAAYVGVLQQGRSGAGYESNLPQISPQEQRRALQPILQARLSALQDAVDRLVEFRQPGAIGWEADVALAKFALNQAQLEIARLTGQRAQVAQFAAADQQLAAEHYWKRFADAEVGLASTPALIQAVSLLNVAPEIRRNFYREAVDQTVIWASVGAGIGRRDEVTRADLDLNWLNGYVKRNDGSLVVNDQSWRESDQLAQTLFRQRLEFYPKGTATLADLSRAWVLRQHMHHVAGEGQYRMPAASRDQQVQNLKTLQEAAAATVDRRGRNAADVTFVHLLAELKATEPTR